ncbi:hypothetical protein PF007_g24354 [Phytophthora fragariae]|uniref:Secreted protein n=1 Tax=Phytophthora fragariae TaxID=53985 RepID=A0A6A3QJI2_9STRA|nr:hypothetical protein PF007_g24354 [Phytophthora fragariae]KAE9281594.1 hypothetical protein PF001_g23705 [Phytophthora fragariae]
MTHAFHLELQFVFIARCTTAALLSWCCRFLPGFAVDKRGLGRVRSTGTTACSVPVVSTLPWVWSSSDSGTRPAGNGVFGTLGSGALASALLSWSGVWIAAPASSSGVAGTASSAVFCGAVGAVLSCLLPVGVSVNADDRLAPVTVCFTSASTAFGWFGSIAKLTWWLLRRRVVVGCCSADRGATFGALWGCFVSGCLGCGVGAAF